jgi:hypothetical protein
MELDPGVKTGQRYRAALKAVMPVAPTVSAIVTSSAQLVRSRRCHGVQKFCASASYACPCIGPMVTASHYNCLNDIPHGRGLPRHSARCDFPCLPVGPSAEYSYCRVLLLRSCALHRTGRHPAAARRPMPTQVTIDSPVDSSRGPAETRATTARVPYCGQPRPVRLTTRLHMPVWATGNRSYEPYLNQRILLGTRCVGLLPSRFRSARWNPAPAVLPL